MSNQLRVRIAPSPTGPLHIGTARTALFNWLFARKNGGEFVLRIEDTDLERSDPKFEEEIKDSLQWLNFEWDEFYKQSERLGIYKKYLQKLLDGGQAFWCEHTVGELEKEKKEQMKRKEAPRHVCSHKHENRQKGIIRLKVDENSTRIIHFDDAIRGTIEWPERTLGDLSLAKGLDTPLYNFAVVIDDYETGITDVIRGEDHISNTPKQILIQEALGIKPPQYAHLPLILGPDRTKLSKRHGATSIKEYREQGYLSDAMVNFMALLGWHPNKSMKHETKNIKNGEKPEDLHYIDELITLFDLKDVQKSPAVFDIKKLNWLNGYYIHQLPPEQFRAAITPFIINELGVNGVKDEYLDKIQHLITERMEKLSDIKDFDYFFKDPEFDKGLLSWKKMSPEEVKKSLTLTKKTLEPVDWDGEQNQTIDKGYIRKKLDDLAKENFDGDRGAIYWPLRVALSGREGSPDPIELLEVLPKETVIKRLEKALS